MTRPFLRACWLASSSGDGEGPSTTAANGYLRLIAAASEVGASRAYRLVEGGSIMQSVKARLADMDLDAYEALPDCLVLTECDTLDSAVALDAHLDEATAEGGGGSHGLRVVVRGIYREITFTPGVEEAPASGFAPAIQLGTFNMASADDEWAITEWYRTRRLPSFSTMKGGIRVRRLVSACGGPAKLGVLYEYASLEARLEHFEPLEAVDHDERHPTAATRTVHPPMSPSIGSALPVEDGRDPNQT